MSFQRREPATPIEAGARAYVRRQAEIARSIRRRVREWFKSPERREADAQIAAVWELSRALSSHQRIDALLCELDARPVPRNLTQRVRPVRWAVAAAGAAAVAVFIGVMASREPAPVSLVVETGLGEQRSLALADGSTATLNTRTRLVVTYSRSLRRVVLEHGEALFVVAKDPARPFIVQAAGGEARAVGTQFAVLTERDQTSVSVLEGRVQVRTLGREQADRPIEIVGAGEAVRYRFGGKLSLPFAADIARIRAWQARRVVFNAAALDDVATEYNRYASVPILVEAPKAAARRISGTFQIADEAAFIEALQSVLPVVIERRPEVLVVRDVMPAADRRHAPVEARP